MEAVKNGVLPLWNPYSYSGHPLLATLQPGVFYPLNVLLLLLPFDLAFNWLVVLHFVLAGAFMYLLVRELGASHSGSLAGALTFMLSGYLLSVHNVISTLFSATWVPLVILVYLRALRRGGYLYSIITGILLTFMFNAGGIEVVFGTMALVAILTAAPSVLITDGPALGKSMPLRNRFIVLSLAFLVFFGLSAVQMFPFVELADLSTRVHGLSYSEATTWSLDFKDLIQFFIPDPYGYGVTDEKYWSNQSWLKTIYLGATPFVFTLFFLMEKRRAAAGFVIVLLSYLCLAMGRNFLLYKYIYAYLPLFNKIRYPVKFLFLLFVFISISCGMGLDSLSMALGEGKRPFVRAAVILLSLAFVAALLFGLLDFFGPQIKDFLVERGIDYPDYNYADINIFNTKRFLFFFITLALVIYGAFRSPALGRRMPALVITLLTVDLFFAHQGFYFTTPSKVYHSKGEVMDFLSKKGGLFRTFTTPKTVKEKVEIEDAGSFDAKRLKSINIDKEKITGYNLSHHIFDMWGIEVTKRMDYTNIYNLIGIQKRPDSTNLLAMLNVRYVISIPPIESDEFRLVKVVGIDKKASSDIEKMKTLKVYENLNCLPRFFAVRDYSVIEDPMDYIRIMQKKSFRPSKLVLLEKDPWGGGARGSGGGEVGYSVDVIHYGLNSIELQVDVDDDSILVASESYYPGWKVYVDGRKRELLRADYVLRAVALEKGSHRVVFSYEPESFRAGAVVSVLTVAGLVAYFSFTAIRRRR